MKSDNREIFLALLSDNRLTQARAAALISEYTRRPSSVRAVRSWINDPQKPSSRRCPDWAVAALIEVLKSSK